MKISTIRTRIAALYKRIFARRFKLRGKRKVGS
jgi:hypothetical protein